MTVFQKGEKNSYSNSAEKKRQTSTFPLSRLSFASQSVRGTLIEVLIKVLTKYFINRYRLFRFVDIDRLSALGNLPQSLLNLLRNRIFFAT